MAEWVRAILTSGQVWGAVLILSDTLIDEFYPQFPDAVQNAVAMLAIAILFALGIKVERDRARASRAHVNIRVIE